MNCTDSLTQILQSLRGLEGLAVILALIYITGAAREKRWCWYAALLSTAIYTYLYWDVTLYMESGLNVYYMAMAVYGWWSWGRSATTQDAPDHGDTIAVVRWGWRQHGLALLLIAGLTLASATALQHTDAAHPYLDSFTTWGAVVTTWMVAKKVLENWLYWIVINSVGIWLNLDRCLLFTVGLLCAYQVISIFGLRAWYQSYREQQAIAHVDEGSCIQCP